MTEKKKSSYLVWLDADLKKEFKIYCAKHDTHGAEVIRNYIKKTVEKAKRANTL